MELLITRNWSKSSYTIGRLFIDGKFICNTMELPIKTREGEKGSRIKSGKYIVRYRYSPHFKRNTLWLNTDDSHFNERYILIHSGNDVSATQGCILVGLNNRIGWLSNSRMMEDKVFDIVFEAIQRKEQVTLKITS